MKRFILTLIIVFAMLLSLPHIADALCVKVTKANLRSGPGTKYEKTWSVYQYMPLQKIKRSGNWYKVKDIDDDIHWVFRNLVTNKYFCGVVKVDEANVRKGPGTRYEKTSYSPIDKYYSFMILKIKKNWVKIKDLDGDIGWIHRKLIWIQ